MAIKKQEKNFLVGIMVFGLVLGLSIVLFPLISNGTSDKKSPPPPNEEVVRVEVAKAPVPNPDPKEPKKENPAKKEPPKKAEKEKPAKPRPKEATLVISKPSKVPTDYFEDGSGVTELPRVVERYLESVKNGSRFMGRLESIALRDNKALEEQRQSVKGGGNLVLERGDLTKVVSYNMKIKTPFLSASFDAAGMDDFKGDVLVEWVGKEDNGRIELFFTPLTRAGEDGQFRLNMPEDLIPPASKVFVYSATDDMPLIASGVYRPK